MNTKHTYHYPITVGTGMEQIADELFASGFAGTVLACEPESDEYYADPIDIAADREHCNVNVGGLPEANAVVTDGLITVATYNLANCTVLVLSGDTRGLLIYPLGSTARDEISDWDYAGGDNQAEFLAGFGFTDLVEAAPRNAKRVSLWDDDANQYIRERDGGIAVFTGAAEAKRWIAKHRDDGVTQCIITASPY